MIHQGSYGATPGIVGGKPTIAKVRKMMDESRRPSIPALIGMVFVPWLIFVITYYLRGFDMHYSSESVCNVFCYILLVPVVVFAYMTFNIAISGKDPVPMGFLTIATLVCWVLGHTLGGATYTAFMRPFYELSGLNTYTRIDPTQWHGSQLMDAGVIKFNAGSRLQLHHSMGFKNEDIYCVAPVVFTNESTGVNAPMEYYDFWAVGKNCCSGHVPDFSCGEYSNPMARMGLRDMNDDSKEMYRLAVQQAEAAFNIKAPHPIFMHWMSDAQAEVEAYSDDGVKYFISSVIAAFAVLSAVVIAFAFICHWILLAH